MRLIIIIIIFFALWWEIRREKNSLFYSNNLDKKKNIEITVSFLYFFHSSIACLSCMQFNLNSRWLRIIISVTLLPERQSNYNTGWSPINFGPSAVARKRERERDPPAILLLLLSLLRRDENLKFTSGEELELASLSFILFFFSS